MSSPAHEFDPSALLRFIHLRSFDTRWARLNLDDEDLRQLQTSIMESPRGHPVMPETGGLRKMRFSRPGSNRSKRESYRVGYVFFPRYGIVLLVVVYAKNDKQDLTPADSAAIRRIIELIEGELERGVNR